MPLRYTGSKQYQSLLVKTIFLLSMSDVFASKYRKARWSDVAASDRIQFRDQTFQAAAEILQKDAEIEGQDPSTKSHTSLLQRHFRICCRGVKCQLRWLGEPAVEATKPRPTKSAKLMGEASGEASHWAECPELPVRAAETDDAYYDRLAAARWKRAGHSNRPEPPTVVWRCKYMNLFDDGPYVILGGVPDQAASDFLCEKRVQLIIPCFSDDPRSMGGMFPDGVLFRNFNLTADREVPQPALSGHGLYMTRAALEDGGSIYLHCMAGIHRAPIGAALILACLEHRTLDWASIQRLRAQ